MARFTYSVFGGVFLVAMAVALLAGCQTGPTGGAGPADGDAGDVTDDGLAEDPRTDVDEAQLSITESDDTGLQGTLAFGLPTTETVEAGGETWTRVKVAGLEDGGDDDGYPCVPVYRCLIGVPRGAEVSLASVTPVEADESQMNLYPFQALEGEFPTEVDLYTTELPPPEIFVPQGFAKDSEAYAEDRSYPSEPCRVTKIGESRDLEIAVLECACGQYNPVTDVMTFLASVDFAVEFSGGSGGFLSDRAGNPFDNSQLVGARAVVNEDAIGEYLSADAPVFAVIGEELLILTHPDYRDQAEELAQWKRDRGILTSVVEVNDGAGPGPDTKEEIDALIDDHYNNQSVRPSYVLLFGDHDDIPTWIMQRLIKDPGVMLATDFPYAQVNTDPDPYHLDFLPDVALGRIPVNTVDQAQTVVDKIIAYESEPPQLEQGGVILPSATEATIAGSFECCWENAPYDGWCYNSFIYNAEQVRTKLISQCYTVQRIYNTSTSHHPGYQGDPTPRYFTTGDPLPFDLAPDSGFAWDGNTPELIDAFNEGRLLFFYFDHGGSTGWSLPRLTNHEENAPPSLPNLTNDALPVVFSMNCSSGAIDLEYGFAEDMLRMSGGGAIGVFAFTRGANAGYLGYVSLGGIDALWPGVLPSFGTGAAKHRLGDLLNHAKAYLASKASAGGTSTWYLNTMNHERLLSLTGDPTLSVWTASSVDMPIDVFLIPEHDYLILHYLVDGAVITALEETEAGFVPIGRGVVTDGVAQLAFVNEPADLSMVRFWASHENAVTRSLILSNEPTAVILEPQSGATFAAGETIAFRGESQDSFGRSLPELSVKWGTTSTACLAPGISWKPHSRRARTRSCSK